MATVLGHIDCPTCGTHKGMRITPDRNGKPFGFCEAGCAQQLRVGGNAHREAQFVRRYPWAASPVTGTAPAPAPKPAPAPAPAHAPVPAPAPAPVPVIAHLKTPAPTAMSNLAQAMQFFKGTP